MTEETMNMGWQPLPADVAEWMGVDPSWVRSEDAPAPVRALRAPEVPAERASRRGRFGSQRRAG